MKIAGIVLIVFGLAVFGYWAASGAEEVTRYKVAHVEKVVDDFGEEEEVTTMREEFRFGLLPDEAFIDGAISLGGGPLGLGVVLLIAGFVRGRKEDD